MRPEVLFPIFAELTALPGVGPRNLKQFEKIAGERVRDLLFLAPSGLIERKPVDSVVEAHEGDVVTVEIEVGAHRPAPRGTSRPYRIDAQDARTSFQLVYFHAQADFLRRILPEGQRRVVSGKIEIYDGVAQMPHPDHVATREETDGIPDIEPVYPLTAGLSLRVLGKVMAAALERAPDLEEWLDPALKAREAWPGWRAAIERLHAPTSLADVSPAAPARRRLAYDELLAHQLGLALARRGATTGRGVATSGDGRLRERVLASLSYQPTGAQSRAVDEIAADMAGPDRMMRLLQGDVGAGKTLVSLLAMLIAVEAGGQAALMAPTEILARQHGQNIGPLAEAAGVRMAVLTGRDKGKARADTVAAITAGEVDIVVGTHALFQRDVAFRDLRLAVIDEQHRFGVEQRMALAEKGGAADVLLATATPIPRTLSLAQFGDMAVSVLDEKPPGRQPIQTRLVSADRYEEVVAGLGRAMDGGARIYWVCPLVEESEAVDLAAAEDRARTLAATLGAERVALVHGRMTGAEKEAAMGRFNSGASQLLVATTVIEVGVDVVEATIIVIERAERFGLAQLHQLRGRVGRGAEASYCLLLFGAELSEPARARLSIMRETEDGFRLAEEDLRLRGAGDLLGVKQSGLPKFFIADLEHDGELMKIARDDAALALQRDPELTSERGQALRLLLHLQERNEAESFLSFG